MAESNIGFEEKIWKAACVLRGNMDASEYKHVVLGLIFLKYLSDSFETRYKELVAEGEGFEEDVDEYTRKGIFFVPENARWSYISKYAHEPIIGKVIDEAMQSIEKSNHRLDGILPDNHFGRPELDKRRLGEVVDLFTNISMADRSKDLLGRVYEYCLSKFAEQEGKLAGEFYTPSCIVKLLVEILKPFNGRIYDPCCGSGGMFVQSAKFIENHQGRIKDISVYGQDSNPTTRKLCAMNLAIRGIEADLGKYADDTFFNDLHPQLKADYILANPPFNLSAWGGDKLVNDKRWVYGVPPTGNANFAWLQHMIHHLSPNGKIGMVLANGALSSNTGGEGEIRANIIKADLVEAIVALPSQLFYTTGIPVTLWFLNKNKTEQTKGKVLFIDAREMGIMETRKLRVLTEQEINDIAFTIENWRHEGEKFDFKVDGESIGSYYAKYYDITTTDESKRIFSNMKGFCKSATIKEIEEQGFILTPGRYVGVAEIEQDSEPFETKMPRLKQELYAMFEESHKLEENIKAQLEKLNKF